MSKIAPRDTPYKGLVPYDEADAPFFFGRDAERDVITANLMGSRLTLVYGPSGVGKSSVLRAGVVHRLRALAREELATRGRPKFLAVFFNSWRDDPLAGLRERLRERVAEALGSEPQLCVLPTTPLADELQLWAEYVGGKMLVVLDQFEEYFLYPQREGAGSFAQEFAAAVNRPDVRANFVISLREDWLAKLDRFKVSIPNLFDNYLRVDWLSVEAARLAIEQPVATYNERRGGDEPEVRIAERFSDKVIEQLGKLAYKDVLGDSASGEVKSAAASARPIQTPYLQLVMTRLWAEALLAEEHVLHPDMLKEKRDPESKAETRAEEIVQSHLNEVLKDLSGEEQEVAARAFYYLVTPDGTKIAQSISNLVGYTEVPRGGLVPVLDRLSGKEMSVLSQLTPPPYQPAEIRYEIFHDVLAPAILAWRKRFMQDKAEAEAKAKILAEAEATQARILAEAEAAQARERKERETEEQRRRLEQAEALAEAERQRAEEQTLRFEAERQRADEQRQRADEQKRHARRAWRLLAGLAAVAVLAIGFALFAWGQRQRVLASQALANQKALEAETNAREAQKLREEAAYLQGEAGELKSAAEKAQQAAIHAQGEAKEQQERARELLAKADAAEAEAVRAQAEARTERGRVEQAKQDANRALKEAHMSKVAAEVFKLDAEMSQAAAEENLKKAKEAEANTVNARAGSLLILQAAGEGTKEALQGVVEKVIPTLSGEQFKSERASALRLIGRRYAALEEPAEAEKFYRMALLEYQSITGREAEVAMISGELAKAYAASSETAKAVQLYRDAAAAYGRAGARDQEAETRITLGRFLFEQDETVKKQAVAEIDAAMKIYESSPKRDYRKEGETLRDLGALYNTTPLREDERQAVNFYKRAAEAYDKIDPEAAATARTEAAEISGSSSSGEPTPQEIEEAIKLYKAALDFYSGKEEYVENELSTLRSLGALYVQQGDKPRAADVFQRVASFILKSRGAGPYASSMSPLISLYRDDPSPNEKRKALPYYGCQLQGYRASNAGAARQASVLRGVSALYESVGDKTKAAAFRACAANAAAGRAYTCHQELGCVELRNVTPGSPATR